MATTLTTTSGFAESVVAAIVRQVTNNLRQGLPWLPKGAVTFDVQKVGENGVWRHFAYPDLPVAGTLVEGVPLAVHKSLDIAYDEFTVAQYGDVVEVSDLAQSRSPHNLLQIAVERVARQAALTSDSVAKAIWAGGGAHPKTLYSDATATQTNATKASVVAADVLQARDVRRAIAYLSSINVPRIGGTMGADGQQHGGSYLVISDVRLLGDFMTETAATGWLDLSRYANTDAILSGEIGQFAGGKFIQSSAGIFDETGGASGTTPIGLTIVTGADAIAFADIGSIQAAFVPPKPSAFDPLGQVGYAGFKAVFGGVAIEGGEDKPRFVAIWSSAPVL